MQHNTLCTLLYLAVAFGSLSAGLTICKMLLILLTFRSIQVNYNICLAKFSWIEGFN